MFGAPQECFPGHRCGTRRACHCQAYTLAPRDVVLGLGPWSWVVLKDKITLRYQHISCCNK